MLPLDPACVSVVSGAVTTVQVACGTDRFHDEISRLKAEKLELLRQNVSSQREVKRLRDRESQLQDDLGAAAREIHRLRSAGKDDVKHAQF
jgi:RAP1 GTPase activating protein 1